MKRCSVDDLWALIAWAEMHAELRPYDEIDDPGIQRATSFLHQEVNRRNRRKAMRQLPGGSSYLWMRPWS